VKKRIVIGIGNPGPEYEGTRHNIGFLVCDELASRAGAPFSKAPYPAQVAQARVKNAVLVLVKPLTYVNLTGELIPPLRAEHAELEDPANLMVVVDDADLPLGRIRIRERGSSGGHNGLKSIIDGLEGREFPRLRVGIGRRTGTALRDHVLSRFDKTERPEVEEVVRRSADAVTTWALSGITICMNEFNRDPKDRKEP
jgi:PTH1 family peptidyl-tRNA hydrolase